MYCKHPYRLHRASLKGDNSRQFSPCGPASENLQLAVVAIEQIVDATIDSKPFAQMLSKTRLVTALPATGCSPLLAVWILEFPCKSAATSIASDCKQVTLTSPRL